MISVRPLFAFLFCVLFANAAVPVSTYFEPEFSSNLILNETGTKEESNSSFWWVNSGGQFIANTGRATTIKGDLSERNYWRLLYNQTNPIDTDNGYHPQNIFRLISKPVLHNSLERVYFKILKYRATQSPQRNSSNGVLLFSRYVDSDNLYYAGLRVDGQAIIKKKVNGIYKTLGSKKIFQGSYDIEDNPNLLPINTWLGIKLITKSTLLGPQITLYYDQAGNGSWQQLLTVVDNHYSSNSSPIYSSGSVGIRTDFMDVEFDGFRANEIY